MTWTYNNTIGDDCDRVRLLVGDTDATDPQLQNEEIDFFLDDDGSVYRAAASCAEALAAKFARQVNYSIYGEVDEFAADRQKNYAALAVRLRKKALRTNVMPLAGGISRSQKEATEADTDRVVPGFAVDMEQEKGTGPNDLPPFPYPPLPF